MHKSFKEFFEKDSVFKVSVVLASILWLINAGFNFAARDYRAFCINVLYALCLCAICRTYYTKEDRVLQGMIGALMMLCVIGNVNVMSEGLEAEIPSRALWQMIIGSVLTLGLFLNHFMIVHNKRKTMWRIKNNQILIMLLLLLRTYQVLVNIISRGFTPLMIEVTVGLLAIIPTLDAIVCIETKTDAYKIDR